MRKLQCFTSELLKFVVFPAVCVQILNVFFYLESSKHSKNLVAYNVEDVE